MRIEEWRDFSATASTDDQSKPDAGRDQEVSEASDVGQARAAGEWQPLAIGGVHVGVRIAGFVGIGLGTVIGSSVRISSCIVVGLGCSIGLCIHVCSGLDTGIGSCIVVR